MAESEKVNSLFGYLSAARHNVKAEVPNYITLFDQALGMIGTYPKYESGLASLRMILLAHSSLRASIFLNLAGATSQVPPLLRHSVEASLYGFEFANDREAFNIWKSREDGVKEKKNARNRLSYGRLRGQLERTSPNFAHEMDILYDDLLMLGAHPNVAQIVMVSASSISEGDDYGTSNFEYLMSSTEREISWAFIASSYRIAIETYRLIFPREFLMLGMEAIFRDAAYHLGRDALAEPHEGEGIN